MATSKAGSAFDASSSLDAAKGYPLTKARFCECGGRLRYRDARKYSIAGVPDGAHRWICEDCAAVKTRWEAATPEERQRERAQSRRASARFRARIRLLIAAAKNRPCADCGGRFPTCVMDLDHVRGQKEFKVSEAVQRAYGTNLARVRAEIAKCDVVCANCHRIRTESAGYGARAPIKRPASGTNASRGEGQSSMSRYTSAARRRSSVG